MSENMNLRAKCLFHRAAQPSFNSTQPCDGYVAVAETCNCNT